MMIFVDLETTGLDPRIDKVIEVAMVATDHELEVLSHFSMVVRPENVDLAISLMAPDVIEMHEASGLLDRLPFGSSAMAVNSSMHSWLNSLGLAGPDSVGPMHGSSVGFDRKFLAEHFPEIEARFHYRNVDFSTVKELVKAWMPDEYEWAPSRPKDHVAINDLMLTIEEARWYKERLFWVPEIPEFVQ